MKSTIMRTLIVLLPLALSACASTRTYLDYKPDSTKPTASISFARGKLIPAIYGIDFFDNAQTCTDRYTGSLKDPAISIKFNKGKPFAFMHTTLDQNASRIKICKGTHVFTPTENEYEVRVSNDENGCSAVVIETNSQGVRSLVKTEQRETITPFSASGSYCSPNK
jgi:hypothetical protein